MAEYRTLIDALNAIDVANGGTGGHAYMIDALNEWAVRLGGTGGHKYTIDALNEIASKEGATTGFHFDIQELNAISTELGGAGGHTYYIDALNEIVDLSDGSGGGGDYVASAVHFDNSTPDSVFLHTNSLIAAADVGVFSGVLWVKTADESGAPTIFVADPENSYGNYAFLDSGSTPVDEFFTHWKSTDGTQQFAAVSSVGLGDDNWHSVIFTVKTDLSLGTKIRKVYVDRVQCSDEEEEYDDTADAFTMTFNGLSFYLGSDGFGGSFTGDLADVRLMPGVSLLTGSDISGATLDLFATAGNKPVDPATATSALGLAGAVLFSGDADTFATNQGTGGAFTLTGSLTNATTSPSD